MALPSKPVVPAISNVTFDGFTVTVTAPSGSTITIQVADFNDIAFSNPVATSTGNTGNITLQNGVTAGVPANAFVPGKTYRVRQIAVNGDGNVPGDSTGPVQIPIPEVGATITVTYDSKSYPTLTWIAPVGFTGAGYNLYRQGSTDMVDGTPDILQSSAPKSYIPWGTTSYKDINLGFPVPGNSTAGTYNYVLKVVTPQGIESVGIAVSANFGI